MAYTLFSQGVAVHCEASALSNLNPTVYLKFNKSPGEEVPADISIKIQGGRAIDQGLSGRAWRLNQGDYLEIALKDKLNPAEGTIMFWVRPHWESTAGDSHTFLSFVWSGEDRPYFTITRGWWEPAGARRTYFIFNNQDHAHISKIIDYEPKGWTHLACTWKGGEPGYLRLYVNGFKAAEGRFTSKKIREVASPLYIGSDQGSPLAKARWAESDLDDVVFMPTALSDEQIFSIFAQQKPPPRQKLQQQGGKVLETRAILDEGVGWATEAGARKTIERIKRAGFNVYVPCVWHGGGTRYPSTKAPLAPGFTILTTDPLKRLIDLAHQNGIEVHPWFCVALRQRDFLPEFYGPGTPDNAFDLHRPGFRSFIVDVILDVVRRYDVDGVNLDYIRTMGLCTCDFCQQEYRRTSGRDLMQDIAQLQPGKSLPPDLQKWQDEAVEDIVRKVSEKAKTIKPNLIISVDGHPQLKPSPEGREEVKWANAGLIDVIFNMDYRKVPDFDTFQTIRHHLKDPARLIMLLGNYDKKETAVGPTEANHLARVVEYVQGRWPGRVGIYLYNQLSDAQIEALAQGPFQRPAKPAWAIKH